MRLRNVAMDGRGLRERIEEREGSDSAPSDPDQASHYEAWMNQAGVDGLTSRASPAGVRPCSFAMMPAPVAAAGPGFSGPRNVRDPFSPRLPTDAGRDPWRCCRLWPSYGRAR